MIDKLTAIINRWVDHGHDEREQEDLTFMPAVEAASRSTGARFAYILTVLTFVFVVGFVIWANFAVLDEVTRGQGQVIPSSRTQVIQNLEGGIVSDIQVREGQIVEKGDILLRIENVTAESNFEEKRSRYLSLMASVARLKAEMEGEEPKFPTEVAENAPDMIEDQMTQYNLRQDQYQAKIDVLQSQARQRRQEIEEMQNRLSQLRNNMAALDEEISMKRPLVEQGVVSKIDLVRLRRERTELQGQISDVRGSIPRLRTAAGEAEQKITEYKSGYLADVSNQINEQRAELESLEKTLSAGADRVTRAQVRSPVRGTVKSINVNTIGGVIKPGEEIMEIVPLDDTLLVEAKIRPADIAFIRPEQPATVKITAYDFSIYGGLKGKVEHISADTIQDEEGDHFYRVQVRTQETALTHRGERLPIIPGMTATVEILTGQKSVLDYLMKPILRAQEQALRER